MDQRCKHKYGIKKSTVEEKKRIKKQIFCNIFYAILKTISHKRLIYLILWKQQFTWQIAIEKAEKQTGKKIVPFMLAMN